MSTLGTTARPTIRLLHGLARGGGTLVSRCLGSMQGVALLSEINPRGVQEYFNPVRQAQRWYGVLTEADRDALRHRLQTFPEVIGLLESRFRARGMSLVIRDWSHLDFVAEPFFAEPTNRLTLAEALAGEFEIASTALVRHPLDQMLSLARVWAGDRPPVLESLLAAARRFAEQVQDVGYVRFEDFTAEPDATLRRMCAHLRLEFDAAYATRWASYDRVTGDVGSGRAAPTEIRTPARATADDELRERLCANEDYVRACALLGYNP